MGDEHGARALESGPGPGGRERGRYLLRLAFALVVFGSLPLGWVRGFRCGSHVLKEESGARLMADHPQAALALVVCALLPVGFGWLAERAKRLRWRLAYDLGSALLGALGAALCSALPGSGFGRHTLLAPAWASVFALGATSLDALAEGAAELARRRAMQKGRPAEGEHSSRPDGPSPYRDRRRGGPRARGRLARARAALGRLFGTFAWRGRFFGAALARWRRGPRVLALAALALAALWAQALIGRAESLSPAREQWRYEFGGHGPPRAGQHFTDTDGGFLVTNRYAPHRVWRRSTRQRGEPSGRSMGRRRRSCRKSLATRFG